MMDIKHPTQSSGTGQAGLDVLHMRISITEAINQTRQSQKVMITVTELV
jgi:predicted component of type VI protein secretion system